MILEHKTYCPSHVATTVFSPALEGSLITSHFSFSTFGGLFAAVIAASVFPSCNSLKTFKYFDQPTEAADGQGFSAK